MKYNVEISLTNGGSYILFEVEQEHVELMKQNFHPAGERLTIPDSDGDTLLKMSDVVLMIFKPFKPDKVIGL